MAKQFRGSYTVTITPFTADGRKIDIPAWKRFVDQFRNPLTVVLAVM